MYAYVYVCVCVYVCVYVCVFVLYKSNLVTDIHVVTPCSTHLLQKLQMFLLYNLAEKCAARCLRNIQCVSSPPPVWTIPSTIQTSPSKQSVLDLLRKAQT